MKDKDFDEIFSKGLSEDLNHKYDTNDWENLEERLDEHDKLIGGIPPAATSATRSKYLPWIGALLLLLIGANSWSLFKMYQSENDKKELFNQINSLKNIIEKQNTAPQQNTIIHKDTVIIYKYLPSYPNEKQKNNNNISTINTIPQNLNKLSESKSSELNHYNTTTSGINPPILPPQKSDTQTAYTTQQIINESKKGFEAVSPLTALKVLPRWYENPSLLILPTTKTNNIIKTQPQKRFWIGLGGGLINYHTSWYTKDSALVSKNINSYQAGLKFEYALNDHWRIIAGGDYCPFSFKIYWQDSRYNLPALPAYFANNPSEYKVKSSEATQSLVQGYAGMKYVFSGNRWKPYLGVAYTQMEILPFDVNYTIQKLSTYKEIPVVVKQNKLAISNIAMLNGGFEYRLSSRFVAQAEGFYYKDLNKTNQTFNLFGLRSSILIGF